MNAEEAIVPKSLLLVLLIGLLVCAAPSAAQTSNHTAATSSGRSVSRDAREQWFSKSIGDILEGRARAPAQRSPNR